MVDCIPAPVEARNEYVLRLLPTVRKFAYRYCAHSEQARDAVQDAMVVLMETFQPGKPAPELMWVVRRVVYKMQRRDAVRLERETQFGTLGTEDNEFEPAVEDELVERTATRETVNRVRQVLQMLSPTERHVVRDGVKRKSVSWSVTVKARTRFRELLAARNLDRVAADGTVPVEELIPLAVACKRYGLRRHSQNLQIVHVKGLKFVSPRVARLRARPVRPAGVRRPLPEPSPGREWRISEIAELLGIDKGKIIRLVNAGTVPTRTVSFVVAGFGTRRLAIVDDADVRELYRTYGEK